MTLEEMQKILEDIKCEDYFFTVKMDGRGEIFLQAHYYEKDIYTGEISLQLTRRWFLSPAMTKSEIVQTVLKCVLTSHEHRVREHFTYKGERIFNPHYDVEVLVELCRQHAFEVREK